MKITFLGHAGMFVETQYGSILCDPWFNPAYFASWFPFPSNEEIDISTIAHPTYLYVSHLHQDHFDAAFLREHVSKDAIVLLPDYPLNLLERALRECGFTHFIATKSGQALTLNGLTVSIISLVAPTDGPIGDSGLTVDDGITRVFDQNDSRPVDIERITAHGPFDAHFVQFSGALWYPMTYQYPPEMQLVLGAKKRENEMARALQYIQHIGASAVFPSAGPACFLDDELFQFNDFDRSKTNTFPDQSVFVEYMQTHGLNNSEILLPGSVLNIEHDKYSVYTPPNMLKQEIFTQKRAYLEGYKARMQARIDAEKQSWPVGQVDILSSLIDWFDPLLQQANLLSAGVNGRILIDCEKHKILLDFHQRRVSEWQQQECDFVFQIAPALVEYCILQRVEDWVNHVFLSCRFKAQRKGAYNEYVYTFFKSLSLERIQYVERYYAEKSLAKQIMWESQGHRMQRYCPHMKGDLSRFGIIEGNVLTCTLHGWQFDLTTGRCLTSENYYLSIQSPSVDEDKQTNDDTVTNTCHHCWHRTLKSETVKSEAVPDSATSPDSVTLPLSATD